MPHHPKFAPILEAVKVAGLNRAEYLELIELLSVLAETSGALDGDFTDQILNASSAGCHKKRSVKQGADRPGCWVESRMINGCGPYLYQRWREGGRVRSQYLGKASDYEP